MNELKKKKKSTFVIFVQIINEIKLTKMNKYDMMKMIIFTLTFKSIWSVRLNVLALAKAAIIWSKTVKTVILLQFKITVFYLIIFEM